MVQPLPGQDLPDREGRAALGRATRSSLGVPRGGLGRPGGGEGDARGQQARRGSGGSQPRG
jgi:hypothetical protein